MRVIFGPKTEIQTFFSPKIRWSPKKKKKVFTEIKSNKRKFFGRKITLNFGEDIRIFELLCLTSQPTKIFYIRHWGGPLEVGGPPEMGGLLCICTLCTFLRPPLKTVSSTDRSRSRDQFFVVSVSVLVLAVLHRSWSWSRTVVVSVS